MLKGLGQKKKGQLTEHYWQYHKLTRDPFSVVNDQTMVVLLPKWEQHLDLIRHVFKTENSLVAVIGESGIGKSTFLSQFTQQFSENYFIHSILADPDLGLRQLNSLLETGFKLTRVDGELLEDRLDAYIMELQYKEKDCLLVVDDAERLPDETLQAMFYLLKQQSKTQMRLHILLMGQPELQLKLAKLARQEISGDLFQSLELEPLSIEEVRNYLQYRCAAAGLVGPLPFSANVIQSIHQSAQGMPANINRLAKQHLINNIAPEELEESMSLYAQYQRKIIGAVVIVGALVGVSWLLGQHSQVPNNPLAKRAAPINLAQNNQTDNLGNTATSDMSSNLNQTSQNVVEDANPEPATTNTNAVNSNNENNNNAQDNDSEDTQPSTAIASQQPAVPAQSQPQPQLQAQTQPQPQPEMQTALNTTTINPAETVKANIKPYYNLHTHKSPATSQQPAVTQDNSNVGVASDVASNQVAKTQPKQQSKVVKNQVVTKPIATASEHHDINSEMFNKKSAKKHSQYAKHSPVKPEKAKAEKTEKAKPEIATSLNRNVLAMPARNYTIQILALSTESAVQQFIKKHHLSDKAHYFQTKANGHTWYVLTYGQYPDRTAALQAKQTLPTTLKKYQSYPRSFANIQAEIHRADS